MLKKTRIVRNTRRVMREATARGSTTVRTAEPIVPATANRPTKNSSTRPAIATSPPLAEQPTAHRPCRAGGRKARGRKALRHLTFHSWGSILYAVTKEAGDEPY